MSIQACSVLQEELFLKHETTGKVLLLQETFVLL